QLQPPVRPLRDADERGRGEVLLDDVMRVVEVARSGDIDVAGHRIASFRGSVWSRNDAHIIPARSRVRNRPSGAIAARARYTRSRTPRLKHPVRCVSIMPTASIMAWTVVGPTNVNPSFFSAFDSAMDSGDVVGTSAGCSGAGETSGLCDQMNA